MQVVINIPTFRYPEHVTYDVISLLRVLSQALSLPNDTVTTQPVLT